MKMKRSTTTPREIVEDADVAIVVSILGQMMLK